MSKEKQTDQRVFPTGSMSPDLSGGGNGAWGQVEHLRGQISKLNKEGMGRSRQDVRYGEDLPSIT